MQKAVFLFGIVLLAVVVRFYYAPAENSLTENSTTENASIKQAKSDLENSETSPFKKAFQAFGEWKQYRKSKSLSGYVEKLPQKKTELIWSLNIGFPLKSGPLVYSGKAYVVAKKGLIVAIDIMTGKKLWQHCYCEPTTGTGLLLENGDSVTHFIGTQKGNFHATNAIKGTPLFNFKTQDQINGSPIVLNMHKGKKQTVIFGSHDCFIYSIDSTSGKLNWKFETDNYQNGTPAQIGNNIFLGGCDGFLRAINPETGSQSFKIELGSYIPASPACYGEMLYIALHEGEIVAVDSASKTIKWRFKADEKSEFLISPLVNDEFVIAVSRKGKILVLDRATGKLFRTINHNAEIISEPVIDQKLLFVADSDGNLIAYELSTGRKLWQKLHGASVEAPVAVLDNAILVADMEGALSLYGWNNKD